MDSSTSVVCRMHTLPADLMHRIFALVITFVDHPSACALLSAVCKRWQSLAAHPYICELIAKKFIVAYPLLKLQMEVPDVVMPVPVTKADKYEIMKRDRPTPLLLRAAAEQFIHYHSDVEYQRLVTRRRGYVLHTFTSLALFFFASFVTIAMLTLEDLDPITVNNWSNAFSCLYATYVCVAGVVVSNVVMRAHFEPQPLFTRIRRNMKLIALTTTALIVVVTTVISPTMMVQYNVMNRDDEDFEPFDWRLCASTGILALLGWQGEILWELRDSIRSWMLSPTLAGLLLGTANLTPFYYAIALYCGAEYCRTSQFPFLLIASIPMFITTAVLAVIFFMDWATSRTNAELIAAVCLTVLCWFPIDLMAFPLRGYTLLPVVFASWGFFSAHLIEARKKMEVAFLNDGDDD